MTDQRNLFITLFRTAVLFFGALLANLCTVQGLSAVLPALPPLAVTAAGSLAALLCGWLLAFCLSGRKPLLSCFGRGRIRHPLGWGALGIFLMQSAGFVGTFFGQAEPSPAHGEPWVMTILLRVMLVPILEESLYRGLLLNIAAPADSSRQSMAFPVVVQGILFGLLHSSPAAMLYAMAGGILLGIFAVKSGSLRFPMAVHIVNNFIAFIQTLLAAQIGTLTARMFGFLVWLIAGAGTIWLRRQGNKEEETHDEISKSSP